MSSTTVPSLQVVGGRRWLARARDVAGVERELSRIWAAAAHDVEASGDERELEAARGEPHLAGRLDRAGDVRVRMRTSVLTLLVVAPRPETAERALDAINVLATRHPSRAVVLAPGDLDGPSRFEAQIFAQCLVPARGAVETCTEQIVVGCGGELAQHLAELVTPLLIHDLPVVLWWPDDPPIGRGQFGELVEEADRMLVDSGTFRDDGALRLVALDEVVRAGRTTVFDVGWLRLALWRELLAGLFDHPLLTPELPTLRSLRIDVAKPGSTLRTAKAALFAGWLAARLGWRLVEPLAARHGAAFPGAMFRSEHGLVHLEIRAAAPGSDPALRSPGSLARVELELGRRGHDVRARVTRQADHLLATADWQGVQVCRRAGRLEHFGDAPYLAEALDRGAPDRVFEAALAQASLLVGAAA
ncbi:MAG TPA: glucose-6-phosphate dehydrogenase assembly protein OpcA [Candidatus Dormibacteraeota bacterium]|nr:glucose-6-phosphate dehydrogenase assembly protein OpcA [Candidatus Dormibacteraeota bacterium]